MITGDLKNQIDRIWDAFWSGGISNPIEVIEQITSAQRSSLGAMDTVVASLQHRAFRGEL